jgi:peptidoglycan/LPS O-acetylase OafA/YrhL
VEPIKVTQALEVHPDNLTALRLLAACMVVYGHGFVFLGLPEPMFMQTQRLPLALLGVYIFFSISGYLVAQSWQRDPSIVRFLIRRSLRIFPALFVCTVLSVCVLGPLLTEVSQAEYWKSEHTRGYFTNIYLYITYYLPGVFTTNKIPNAVNGSLWSLPVEFGMYLLIAIIGFARAPKWGVLAAALVFMALSSGWAFQATEMLVFYRTDMRQLVLCGVYFFVGACIYQFKVDRFFNLTYALAAVIVWLALSRWIVVFIMASWVFLPFIVLAFGTAKNSPLARLTPWDFSYGIYIYAFPIQQTIVYLFPKIDFLAYFGSTFVITVALAAVSWLFVEKPALKLKPFRG